MDPYRSGPVEQRASAAGDRGIVGDVIGQFADRYAFLRELVQNAIDAGAETVEVAIEQDGEIIHVSVRDRGEGMTRDIIEDQLLVLFRSTKETDRSKIGKFGIGFVSVLAPDPEVVVVQSARDGRRLTAHLYRDLTYELFDSGPATQHGTTVTVDLRATTADEVDELVRASRFALDRWCRHAMVPIELRIVVAGQPPSKTRIDRPLAIEDALVEVRASDGERTIVAGLTGGPPHVGFFNHGLTLYETSEALCGPAVVKIQDSRLGHTLSRDDVRRDAAFEQAIEAARDLVTRQLPVTASAELHAAAEAGDLERHRTLIAACGALTLPAIRVPLVEPLRDARSSETRSIDARALGKRAWMARKRSALTAALAAGTPIVHTTDAPALQRAINIMLVDVESELTLVTPQPQEPIAGFVADLLAAIGLAVPVELAMFDGAFGSVLALAGRSETSAYVLDQDAAARSPFARLRKSVLVLSTRHALLRAALEGDPRLAASHLVRVLLLGYRMLDEQRSRKLLDRTFALGVAP